MVRMLTEAKVLLCCPKSIHESDDRPNRNGEGSPTRSPKARLQTTALPDLDSYLNPQQTLSFWRTPNFPLQHLKGYNVSFMTELLTSRLERKSLLTRDRSQIPIKISRIWASSMGQSICALNSQRKHFLRRVRGRCLDSGFMFAPRWGRFKALTVSNEKITKLIDT